MDQPKAGQKIVPRRGDTVAWVLYDVANTIYAASISFLLFPYVTGLGQFESFTYLQTISMILSGLAVPLMAAIADRTGKAATYLNIFSIGCISGMLVFGVDPPMWLFMAAFMVANFAYNSALVFYNALLPSVSTPKNEGLVSGLGVGLGYLGTLVALALILGFKNSIGEAPTFLMLAGCFLILAIPAMLRLKDKRELDNAPLSKALVGEQFQSLKGTLKSLKRNKNLRNFLIANFLCVDVINTAIVVFVVFTLAVFAGQQLDLFGMPMDLRIHVIPDNAEISVPGAVGIATVLGAGLNILALAAGVTLGVLADRWGALRAMRLAAISLALALALGVAFSGNAFSKESRQDLGALNREYKALEQNEESVSLSDAARSFQAIAESEGGSLVHQESESDGSEGKEELVLELPASGNISAFALVLVVLGAFGLAGIWTAGRKVLLELAPKEQVGAYFGLYGITVKISVLGTALFGFLMERFTPQIAMIALFGLLLPGIILLFRVKSEPEDQELEAPSE